MTQIIQLQNVSKSELYEHIETIIDKKLSSLPSVKKDENLSVKVISEELEVAELTVHNWIKNGYLKGSKIGRRVFVKRSDLESAFQEIKSLKYKR